MVAFSIGPIAAKTEQNRREREGKMEGREGEGLRPRCEIVALALHIGNLFLKPVFNTFQKPCYKLCRNLQHLRRSDDS